MISRLISIVVCICSIQAAFCQKKNNGAIRKVYNLNTNWAFCRGDVKGAESVSFNDEKWYAVSIPHTMRLEQKHNGGAQVYQGVGWYRRYFKISKQADGKRITLNFEGVQKNCDVFLNGEKIAVHYGGYLGFVIDITSQVKWNQTNVLALRVVNTNDPLTPPGKELSKLDFNYYGGIYRNVSLVMTDKIYISDPLEANKIAGGGLFITYPQVSKQRAEIQIKTHLINGTGRGDSVTLVSSIRDKNEKEVARSVSKDVLKSEIELGQNLVVLQPKLWHPDHPYQYHLVSQVYSGKKLVDEKTTLMGIRSISFQSAEGKADGFYINGEKLYLRGANRHQNYQFIGDAAANSMQYRDAFQLKKGGFNAVRAAHYPQSPAFLDACDKIGLLVIECEPGWQMFNKDSIFIKRTYQQVREMIRRDRNRPSVFLWETSLNESPTPDSWAKEMVRVAHEEMPTNQMFTADDFFAKGRKYYDVSYKVINEDGTDPDPKMPSLTREWGDTWIADPQKENGLRASRMYTAKGLLAQCILRQNALNGTMLEEEGGYWDHAKLDANKRISGYFLWSYNDYTRGSDAITAFSGVVDIDRYEKFGYYQLQAMQDARNPVYGPMVFIAGYNSRPDLDSTITVFSNCDRVKLYRNNQLMGEMSRESNAHTAAFLAAKGGSPYYTFKIGKYRSGDLKAEGIIDNKVVTTHVVSTPGKADHLEIEVADRGIKAVADGSDMIPVYIKVCDKKGTVITNTKAQQSFKVDLHVAGKGILIGASVPRIEAAVQFTEGGIGYGLIQTSERAGDIQVTANSSGLKPATIVIKTIPYNGKFLPDGVHPKWKIEKEMQHLSLIHI
nr:glycoside hydrolase family 2 TIM barrel-domain containing protein [Pedobacter sp. ASV19]